VTPIIKATKRDQVVSFFTINEFKEWADHQPNLSSWTTKYYKGLGTSTNTEAKQYFANLKKHVIAFKYQDIEDFDSINMAFNKGKADERKLWLNTFLEENFVDHNVKELRYRDFVNKELI
jgi:DNA topoisomerase-2